MEEFLFRVFISSENEPFEIFKFHDFGEIDVDGIYKSRSQVAGGPFAEFFSTSATTNITGDKMHKECQCFWGLDGRTTDLQESCPPPGFSYSFTLQTIPVSGSR